MGTQADLATFGLGMALLSAAGTAQVRAADIDLFKPLTTFVIDAPDGPTPGQPVQTYSPTGPAPDWHIAQWAIPGGQLPAFTPLGGGALASQAAEASVRVAPAGDGTSSIALSQDGSVLPCTTDTGRPRESDFLVQPSGQHPLPPSRPGSTQASGFSPPLSTLRALTQSIVVKATTGPAKQSKGCAVNQGSALMVIILNDKAVTPKQTLFYQLSLISLCGPGSPQRRAACLRGFAHMHPFARDNPFGMSDSLVVAAGAELTNGVEQHLSIDLLSRLTQAIQEGPETMDHDMSHWRIGSAYFGQHIWGDVAIDSTWRDYHLVASTAAD